MAINRTNSKALEDQSTKATNATEENKPGSHIKHSLNLLDTKAVSTNDTDVYKKVQESDLCDLYNALATKDNVECQLLCDEFGPCDERGPCDEVCDEKGCDEVCDKLCDEFGPCNRDACDELCDEFDHCDWNV